MNTANYVSDFIAKGKAEGKPLMQLAWETALACVGWAYVFGARGEQCTPEIRRKYYASKGAEHPTIKTACKGFDSGVCTGCKWYPKGERTRVFDCRGFTYWVLKQVYNWELMGAGATSQWSNGSNWKAKGEIGTMPKDTLVCLFVQKGKTMSHTGFGYNNETCECSAGVQYFKTRNKKWTHWGIPACVDASVPIPTPPETPSKDEDEKKDDQHLPTLKRGNKGEYVTLLQTKLVQKGYSVGSCGIDGDFGSATLKAVKEFQKDHGLTDDGIVGAKTWAALNEQSTNLYTVTIPHLPKFKAEALLKDYAGSSMVEERG